MPDYFDLTHTLRDGMPVFTGDPATLLTAVTNITRDGFSNYRLDTGMHTGTHIDAPFHMLPDGARICDIAPERFFGRGRLIDARGCSVVGPELLNGAEIAPGDIVLLRTGHSTRFGDPRYFLDYPEVSEGFARALVDAGVAMLGLDTPSPDRAPYLVHKLLLGNGIPIIENLAGLDALAHAGAFEVIALPAKFDTDAAPARVIARIR